MAANRHRPTADPAYTAAFDRLLDVLSAELLSRFEEEEGGSHDEPDEWRSDNGNRKTEEAANESTLA